MFSWIGELALRFIAPPRCAACDAALESEAIFCGPCARTVERVAGPGGRAHAVAAWGGAIATAILRFKYLGRTDLARPLAHLLLSIARELPPVDVVVPVPLHPARLRERGYNQAALLGRPVARHLGCNFAPVALSRVRVTRVQASLDKASRASNVVGAFAVREPAKIAGARVLLLDDVRTTGATLEACATALEAAGAAHVHFLTVAQAPRTSETSGAGAGT